MSTCVYTRINPASVAITSRDTTLERTLHAFLIAAHSETCATMSSLCLLLMLNRVEAAMPSHPPLPRQTNPQNAEIQCYKLIQQVAEPLLLARSNRAADVHRTAVKDTHLCEVYWLSTSCFLGGSQDAGICELASSAFLPRWHDIWTQPSEMSCVHLLVAGPMSNPRSCEAIASRLTLRYGSQDQNSRFVRKRSLYMNGIYTSSNS